MRCLTKAIKERFKTVPQTKVILHSDRGTQFSSKHYNQFIKQFEQFIIPSMSRENTPTDNSVAERFMRTVKEHKINGKILEQSIQEEIISKNNSASPNFRKLVNNYITSLNQKPNKKSYSKAPKRHDKDVTVASFLMQKPLYTKAFSKRYGKDKRRKEIDKFKSENLKVVNLLKEIAATKAEIVDRTPFDHLEGNLELELIEKRLTEICELLENNQHIVQKSVAGVIQPVNDNVDQLREQFNEEMLSLNKKIDRLLPKNKKKARYSATP